MKTSQSKCEKKSAECTTSDSRVTQQEIVEALRELAKYEKQVNLLKAAAYTEQMAKNIKQHGIAPPDCVKQADEETHRRVDDAVRAGRIFDKRFRGGFVSVPAEPTQEMIDAGIMFGTSPTKVSIIWSNMLAAAPEVKP